MGDAPAAIQHGVPPEPKMAFHPPAPHLQLKMAAPSETPPTVENTLPQLKIASLPLEFKMAFHTPTVEDAGFVSTIEDCFFN